VKFFNIAYGTAKECQAMIQLAQVEDHNLVDLNDKLCAFIYKLMRGYG